MQVLSKEEFETEKDVILSKIKEGYVFIHPTDTIYGIGCDATNSKAVQKVREVKQRPDTPFSIIAPSKEWIHENCEVDDNAKKWIDKLPGPYTLILKLKNKEVIAKEVAPGRGTVGIRIPDHCVKEIVKELGFPIITTSANIKGDDFMTSDEDLDGRIKGMIEFMVYEGEKHGKPSKIIDLTSGEKIIER